jgi:hypothetical protein
MLAFALVLLAQRCACVANPHCCHHLSFIPTTAVIPLCCRRRDFFLRPENYAGCQSLLVRRFGELVRKVWNPRAFKGQVSPHEFMQASTWLGAPNACLLSLLHMLLMMALVHGWQAGARIQVFQLQRADRLPCPAAPAGGDVCQRQAIHH